MAEKEERRESPLHSGILAQIRAAHLDKAAGNADPIAPVLKSPAWKERLLSQRRAHDEACAEAEPSHGDCGTEPAAPAAAQEAEAESRGETRCIAAELESARARISELSQLLHDRTTAMDKLRDALKSERAENTRLRDQHRIELEVQRAAYRDLVDAYEQFQTQSDELLRESEELNERLRQDQGRTPERFQHILAAEQHPGLTPRAAPLLPSLNV